MYYILLQGVSKIPASIQESRTPKTTTIMFVRVVTQCRKVQMFLRNILTPSSVLDCVGYINRLQEERSVIPTGVGEEIQADAAQSGRWKGNGNSKWQTMYVFITIGKCNSEKG
jgi:hypothetical protein